MYSFFVLGFIPGTSLQITFQLWLDWMLMSVMLLCLYWLYQHRTHKDLLVALAVVYSQARQLFNETRSDVMAWLKAVARDQYQVWNDFGRSTQEPQV